MESTLFTNSNEIFSILQDYGVNVKEVDATTQSEIQDIIIFDQHLLPPGTGDEITFTLQELETLRPAWGNWRLPRIRAQSCIPEYTHQSTMFFDGRRHYDIYYEIERGCYVFDKAWARPEHFRSMDVLYTTECLGHESRETIRRLLKIPRLAQDITQSVYYKVDLGCPLSLYELQLSVVEAFKKLL